MNAITKPVPAPVPSPREEARAALDAARAREADLRLQLAIAESAHEAAVKARAELVKGVASGGTPDPAAVRAAAAEIVATEERIALYRDALADAEAVTKRAEGELRALLRSATTAEFARVAARLEDARRRRDEQQAEMHRLDALLDTLRWAQQNSANHTLEELEDVLARAAEAAQ